MELSDLKRSLEDKLAKEVAGADSSIFSNNRSPPSEVEASTHAHIPEGAMVRRNVHSYSENEIREFLGIATTSKKSDEKKKNTQRKDVFPPAGEIDRKRSAEEIKNMADDAFLKKLFAQADKVESSKRQATTKQDTTTLSTKRQTKQDTKNKKKAEIPKFLREALLADEKKRVASNNVDKKLLKEFSVNKVYQHFGHQEKKTGKVVFFLFCLRRPRLLRKRRDIWDFTSLN